MLLVFDEVKRGHYQRNASIRPEKRRDSIDEAEAALSPHGPPGWAGGRPYSVARGGGGGH